MLNEDLVVESSFVVPRSSDADGDKKLTLANKRDSLRVDREVAGSSALLSLMQDFEGSQQSQKNINQWNFSHTFVMMRLRGEGCAEGEADVWSGAVGVTSVKVSSKPDCGFKFFDLKFSKPVARTESEVLELRLEYRVPHASIDKNKESVFRNESDDCDVTALYKLLQDPSLNLCESQLTTEDIADSVEGVFEAVRAAKASEGRSLNLYECIGVLRILRNRIFGHAQFKIGEAKYVQAKAVLEYLASALEVYFGSVLEDESKPYFRGSGAFSELFREKHDDVKAAARRVRASLANNVAPDAAMERSLDGSDEDFDSAMQSNFSAAEYRLLCQVAKQFQGEPPSEVVSESTAGCDGITSGDMSSEEGRPRTGQTTAPPAATLMACIRILREELHMADNIGTPGEIIDQVVKWITHGDSAEQCNAQKGLLKRAQYLVSEALPVFQLRIATLRKQLEITDADTEAASPQAVIDRAIVVIGVDSDALAASEPSLLRKVNYLLCEVLGEDL